MSNFKFTFLFTALVLVLGGVTAANAQFGFATALKVHIPNEFVVENKVFPAGDYTIAPTENLADSSSLLILRGEKRSMVFDTISASSIEPSKTTRLIFDVVDGTNYLSQIWLQGEITGIEIPKSKFEKRLIAANKSMPQVVVPTSTDF